MGLCSKRIETGGIALAYELIEIRSSLDIGDLGLCMQCFAYKIEIDAGIEYIGEFGNQFFRVISYTTVQVCKIGVEVVIHFKISACRLVKGRHLRQTRDIHNGRNG